MRFNQPALHRKLHCDRTTGKNSSDCEALPPMECIPAHAGDI